MNERFIALSAIAALSLTSCVEPDSAPRAPRALYAEPPETTNKDTDPYEFQKLLAENMKKSHFNESEYTKEAGLSQRTIKLNYIYFSVQNGKPVPETLKYRMSASVVELNNYNNKDYVLIITAAHGLSWQVIGDEIGNDNVIQNLELDSLLVGDSVNLKADDFGVDFLFNLTGSELDDLAIIAIDKDRLSAADLESISRGAISSNSITFSPSNFDQEFYGTCQPTDNLPPVTTDDARIVGDVKNLSTAENWDIEGKCSGAGFFRYDSEQRQQLAGVAVRYYPDENDKTAAIYMFSTLGKENFEKSVQKAIDSIQPTN